MNRMSIQPVQSQKRPIHITEAAIQLLQTHAVPASGQKADAERADQLVMSHDTILINEALATAHNTPDLRQGRVAALKERIASGTYEINCKNIALGIIGDNPELFKA